MGMLIMILYFNTWQEKYNKKTERETMPRKKTTKKKQPNILKGLRIEVLADNKKDKQEFQKGLSQFLLKKYQQGYFN